MSLFAELKRRNVIKVVVAYIVTSWLVAQVAQLAAESFGAPDWVMKMFITLLALGFPIAIIFSWAFEMTPDGIKKEKEVERSQSITRKTGRKLDFTIIGVLVLVAAYFVWESRFSEMGSEPFSQEPTVQKTEASDEKSDPTLAKTDNSIAVLPFANRSNVDDDLFFTDGIHDDLLTQLAKISDLRVISRTSVMEYRDTTKKIPEIAAELGVSTILEGGIQRAGNRIRINAQLIDVSTDEHLWAETFDREMTVENIFDIQSEITRHIVTAVRGELSDAESEVLAQLPTRSLEAYEALLQARTVLNGPNYNQEKFIEAEIWAKKAVDKDPEFALAWAMLVSIHGQAIWQGYDDSPERQQLMRQALSKATQYGPFLPETLAARAQYLYRVENNFHEAEVAFRAASKAKPGDARSFNGLAFSQRRTGKWDQAISNFQLAIEQDPDLTLSRLMIAETLILMGEYERVEPLTNSWIEKYPKALDIKGYKTYVLISKYGDLAAARNWLDQLEPSSGIPFFFMITELPFLERDFQTAINAWEHPQFAPFHGQPWFERDKLETISRAYRYAGEIDKANEFAHQALQAALTYESVIDLNKAFNMLDLAMTYMHTGDTEKALEFADKARDLMPESRNSLDGPVIAATHAMIMAMAGHRDEALAEIERLLNTPSGLDRQMVYLHPDWDFFRDDERFNELVRPLNLREAEK